MDTLYIGDIPSEYHYARFFNGYIDLYNTPDLVNKTVTKYRIYTNVDGFYYDVSEETFNYYDYTATNINVTDNICYRTDFANICSVTFIIVVFGVFLFNLISSAIRKGGLLGGLL